MAFCEVAKRECEYLDVINTLEEELIGEQIDERTDDLPVFTDCLAESIGHFKPETAEGELSCSDNACGPIKRLLLKGIMNNAHNLNEIADNKAEEAQGDIE